MEQLKTIITAACMLSIAVGLCHVLKPNKLFEQQVRFLISLLFVISLAAPLLQIDWQIRPSELAEMQDNAYTEQLTEEAANIVLHETETQAEAALQRMLAEKGIACSELTASAHIDEEQRIYISEVSAVCSHVQQTCEILRENLGEEVTLHVAEMAQ